MDIFGYTKLSNPYPSFIDIDFINGNVTQQNFGIDVMSQKPLIHRTGEWLEYNQETMQDVVTRDIVFVTCLVLRWLQENEITGDVILCWQLVRDKFDVRIGCGAYKSF